MPKPIIALLIALLALAVAKQVFNRRSRFRASACCAFGEAVIAAAVFSDAALPPFVRIVAAALFMIEIASGTAYLRKAKPKPRAE